MLPTFAVEQLQVLLQTMWSDEARAKAGVKFSYGDVIIAVKGGETVDDVVGPMVNRAVVVQAIKKADGRHTLVDIQAEE